MRGDGDVGNARPSLPVRTSRLRRVRRPGDRPKDAGRAADWMHFPEPGGLPAGCAGMTPPETDALI